MSKYQYTVEGVDYDVEIEEIEDNLAKVSVNGIPFEVELKQAVKPTQRHVRKPVVAPQPAAEEAKPVEKPAAKAAVPAGAGSKIMAPLPGTITELKVKEGDTVKAGDTVIILEAMKMQNNIESEYSGTVTSVLVNRGDTVMEGSVLLTIG